MNSKNFSKFHGFEQYYKKNKVMMKRKAIKYQRCKESVGINKTVDVSVESAIALIINEKYRLNILCTCQQIEALSVGYLICEGLITSINDIKSIELKDDNKVYIATRNSNEDFFYWTEIRTSGCIGIKKQFETIDNIIESDVKITPEIFFKAQEKMNQLSTIWKISGGAHMAGLFDCDGTLLSYAEDVGRHNTIDKIVGEAAINAIKMSTCFVITSGRLSAAMIAKLVRAGIPIVISISAPTVQGLEIAGKSHMTVVGFSREPLFNIYTNSDRIIL